MAHPIKNVPLALQGNRSARYFPGMSDGTHLTATFRERAALAAISGMGFSTVAAVYGVDRKTVSRWVTKYSDRGWTALQRKVGSGRPHKLEELTEDELSSIVLQGAIDTTGTLHLPGFRQ